MVKKIVCVLLILPALTLLSQENLVLGQNLNDYLGSHPPTFKTKGPGILTIPEGTIDFYKYKAQTDDADLKILMILDKYPVGVLQSENGKSRLLYDLTGDGVLDTYTENMEIPFWVVARNTEDKLKTSTDTIKAYLDTYYQMFQNDEDPYSSGKYAAHYKLVLQQALLPDHENRDLVYALSCYYRWGNKYARGALASANYLANAYFQRFHAIHPLSYLQFIETLINIGDMATAKTMVDNLLKVDGSSLLAEIYRWQLETDPEKKKTYFNELKSKHPNHWIIKQIWAFRRIWGGNGFRVAKIGWPGSREEWIAKVDQSSAAQTQSGAAVSDGAFLPLTEMTEQQEIHAFSAVGGGCFPMPARFDGYLFSGRGHFVHFGLSEITMQTRYRGSAVK
jgi:hypothetical protein